MNYPLVHIPDPARHAFASPSKLETIKLCHYAAKCCENWDSPTSAAAARGKLMHQAVYNNTALAKLSKEDQEIITDLRRSFIKPYASFVQYDLWYEKLLYLCDEKGRVITYGTVDFLAVRGDTAILIDWKFGNSPVPGFNNNLQLKAYAAAVFQAFPEIKTIYPMIVQPSINAEPNCEVYVAVTRKTLPELVQEIAEVVAEARNATPIDANPSSDACVFCNKKGCSKYNTNMLRAVNNYTGGIVAVSDMPNNLPMKELLVWCDSNLPEVELVESFLHDLKDNIKKVIKEAGGSEHYRLTKPVERATIDYKTMISDLGISAEVVETYTTIKIGEPMVIKKNKKRG